MSPPVDAPSEITRPVARRTVGPGQRIMALTGVGVVLWVAGWFLVIRPAVYIGGPALVGILLFAGLPFGVGWFLGRQAGGPQWWEAALAALISLWLHGMLTAALSGAVHVAMAPDAGIMALPAILLMMLAGSKASFGVIQLAALGGGAFVGARGSTLPAPVASSPRWRRVGVYSVFIPLIIALLATLPSTVGGAAELWRAARATAGDPASPRSSASPGGPADPVVAPRAGAASTTSTTSPTSATAAAPTHADSTAHVLASLLDVMEAQAMYRATHDTGYAPTAAELGYSGGSLDLTISGASDDGWSGVLRDARRPSLWCAVVVGRVPPERRPAEAAGRPAERPYCGT